MARDHPSVARFQNDLAMSHNNVGVSREETGDFQGALESYGQAIEIQTKLLRNDPARAHYRDMLAESLGNLARLKKDMGDREGALSSYEKALDIQEKLVREYPTVADYACRLARTQIGLGLIRFRTEPRRALGSLIEAVNILSKLVHEHPSIEVYQHDLADAHQNLGALLSTTGDLLDALGTIQSSLQIRSTLAELHPSDARLRTSLAGGYYERASILARLGSRSGKNRGPGSAQESGKSREYSDRAMEALRQAVRAGWKATEQTRKDPDLAPLRAREDFRVLLMDMEFPAEPFADPIRKP